MVLKGSEMIEKQVEGVLSKERKRFMNDNKFRSLILKIADLKEKGLNGSPSYKLPMRDTIGRYDSFSGKIYNS